MEITVRNPCAIECIAYIKKNYPTLLVGAETVIKKELMAATIDAGADFCVSPAYDDKLINKAHARDIFFLPAREPPTEMLYAAKQGGMAPKDIPETGNTDEVIARIAHCCKICDGQQANV